MGFDTIEINLVLNHLPLNISDHELCFELVIYFAKMSPHGLRESMPGRGVAATKEVYSAQHFN